MPLCGKIYEFPGFVSNLTVCNDRLLFNEGKRLRGIDSSGMKILYECKEDCPMIVTSEGICVGSSRDLSESNDLYQFKDLFDQGKTYEKQDIPMESGKFDGEVCVCRRVDRKTREKFLIVKDLKTKKVLSKPVKS